MSQQVQVFLIMQNKTALNSNCDKLSALSIQFLHLRAITATSKGRFFQILTTSTDPLNFMKSLRS